MRRAFQFSLATTAAVTLTLGWMAVASTASASAATQTSADCFEYVLTHSSAPLNEIQTACNYGEQGGIAEWTCRVILEGNGVAELVAVNGCYLAGR
jgi:hypothetical protein